MLHYNDNDLYLALVFKKFDSIRSQVRLGSVSVAWPVTAAPADQQQFLGFLGLVVVPYIDANVCAVRQFEPQMFIAES